jgi:hypothetical protein
MRSFVPGSAFAQETKFVIDISERAQRDTVGYRGREHGRHGFFRDCSEVQGREPGPINIQRTIGGPLY